MLLTYTARITGAGLGLRTTAQATAALIFEVIGEGLRQVRGYDGEPAWQLALVRRQ